MNKVRTLFLIAVFVGISLFFGGSIKAGVIDFTGGVITFFKNSVEFVKNKTNEHFNQVDEIQRLRAQNVELRKSAILLSTFAHELNEILLDSNSSKYSPDIKLIRTLSYVNIGDYTKFWVDFDEFNQSKVYGAIYQGNTAGIVVENDKRPVAILQDDDKASFSVYIGSTQIPGIVKGDGKSVIVKFIPQWLNPQVGDEVVTSGLDKIFFAGVPVGRVVKVVDEDLYKSAVVEPYFKENVPAFLYVVTKEE
ncbi:rod shape-determining protein MreC [Campylobacter geochelonis]|uniref:Rod shape-determining protein MreC n=1 Tax=Campylobacter geochelonis TaxID=1780362 RepID=A0A128ECG1_9BACT|nr:rod shape-determining protein MreC [Campylobacter geochelonis]QKF70590.1 rod shape-determining protein MreC [Campylobacter geochelonis]CZE45973.1 rod shape-determining protein MreC [Campylobacter geochelonis]CZE46660.1 rod shape-determining protein MreC [Campylobacter geochelonis]CZE50367.1 rod shape-determining protein MreC [Campylobacter geochelonis]